MPIETNLRVLWEGQRRLGVVLVLRNRPCMLWTTRSLMARLTLIGFGQEVLRTLKVITSLTALMIQF
jgi:hypothetical protein